MLTSFKKSWILLVIITVVYLVTPLLVRMDWFQALTSDPKGLGAIILYFPVANFAVGLAGALRHGFSIWRVLAAAALSVLSWFLYYDGAVQLDAIVLYGAVYAVCGLLGEGAGVLTRKLLQGRTRPAAARAS